MKRIYWPIALNTLSLLNFHLDIATTFYMFYGTNMFIVLMSTQLSYLSICMLLTYKNCLVASRQTQVKFLMWSGMFLIWCAKNCYVAHVCLKHPNAPGQHFSYETAIFHSLFALNSLILFFLLVKSSITLENFFEFWDVDKVMKSNVFSSIWIIQSLISVFVCVNTVSEQDLFSYKG